MSYHIKNASNIKSNTARFIQLFKLFCNPYLGEIWVFKFYYFYYSQVIMEFFSWFLLGCGILADGLDENIDDVAGYHGVPRQRVVGTSVIIADNLNRHKATVPHDLNELASLLAADRCRTNSHTVCTLWDIGSKMAIRGFREPDHDLVWLCFGRARGDALFQHAHNLKSLLIREAQKWHHFNGRRFRSDFRKTQYSVFN